MMDLLAQILDEAFWGLQSPDSVTMAFHLEAIKELIKEYETGMEASLIPGEVRVV